jgi:predicted DNA-binding antitoxin AbrB/MazE fold protein
VPKRAASKDAFFSRGLRPKAPGAQRARDTIMVVRLVEAQYENGVLRPVERLGLRSGERVNLMVLRRPAPRRWDLARLSGMNQEDLTLSEQGLAEWANSLDGTEQS